MQQCIDNIQGVNWEKSIMKWYVQITINHKGIYLGLFVDKLSAVKARYEAELEYNWNTGNMSSAKKYLDENS